MSTASLVYVGDPLCSWCYAFGPQFEAVRAACGLDVRMVMGGLFVGQNTQPLDDELRHYLQETWTRVGELSGRPVSFELLGWPTWLYDTEPACRAVIAVRAAEPASTYSAFDSIQQAFYAKNADVADSDVIAEVLAAAGLVASGFDAPDTGGDAFQADLDEAARLGVRGFPTLFLDTGAEQIVVSAGYGRAGDILRRIDVLG